MRLIFDTHLDLAWNALSWDRDVTLPLHQINARESGMGKKKKGTGPICRNGPKGASHKLDLSPFPPRGRATVSLPEMRSGGVAVCLATVLVRAKPDVRPRETPPRNSVDYPTQSAAYAVGQGQMAYYRLLEEQGEVKILRTRGDLDAHWKRWREEERTKRPIGIILAMEGADPIVEPSQAPQWFADGMRSVGLAHYGKSRYAVGTGEVGPLSAAGVELLDEFERLGMILDVTHLSQPSFDEALKRFGGPVMASHNNCRALVPGDRQFSDDQIRRLVARDAVIGVALDAWMLYPGWKIGETSREVVALDAVADHVDHICQLAGNARHVGIGSDLDGGFGTEQTPTGIDTIADLQKLAGMLSNRGYSEEHIDAVFHGNWLGFFQRHLPDGKP